MCRMKSPVGDWQGANVRPIVKLLYMEVDNEMLIAHVKCLVLAYQ